MKNFTPTTFCLIAIFCLAACVGPRIPAYETKTQKFDWGSAHAWMTKTPGSASEATSGFGHLLLNTSYNASVLNKNCSLAPKRILISDINGETIVLDESPSYDNGTPLSRSIGQHPTGQLGFSSAPFNFDREKMPYDVSIKLSLNCPDKQNDYEFYKKLKFKMVQPVIWEQ